MSDEKQGMEGENFAEMMQQAFEEGGGEALKVGDKVTGRVVAITEANVFVNVGGKIDGVVERPELLDKDGALPVKEGEEIELYVVETGGGNIRLSKALAGFSDVAGLRDAFEGQVPVEGKVTATRKGGFEVDVLGRRTFCPVSQIDDHYASDPEQYVGQTFQFQIIKFEGGGRNIVVSRRKILDRDRAEQQEKFLAEAKPGAILSGKVARLVDFGAFVEIAPGVEGLVHVSELGWSRVEKPSELVKEGDEVTVKVLSVESGKGGRLKVSLSMKQAGEDPWTTVGNTFAAGQKVPGKVRRLTPFGAFVEIAPGIEGLVHVSEMSYTRRVHKPEDVVQAGQDVMVAVKDVDLANRRISLSIRDAEGDPWADVAARFPVGSKVEGTMEKREKFGLFINLAPGVTGLMPSSRIARSPSAAEFDKLKAGDTVAAAVEEVRLGERKITLAPADAREAEDWKAYAPKPERAEKQASGQGQGLGLLGLKLQEAMKKKK